MPTSLVRIVCEAIAEGNLFVMEASVERYCAGSSTNDVQALLDVLTPDAELVSPISGRMVFRGKDDLKVLLQVLYSTIKGLKWETRIGNGGVQLAMGSGQVGPLSIGDAMVFELAADGRIQRIRPHLRPWLAVTLLAMRLVAKLSSHPGVILRALRANSTARL